MKKKIALMLSLLAVLLVFAGCTSQSADSRNLLSQPIEDSRFLIGTNVSIRIWDKDKEEVLERAYALIQEIGDKIDTNNNINSQLDQVNAASGKHPVVIDEDVFWMVQKAVSYAQMSNGVFDPTIGPITNLWRIGFDDARKPSQAEIDEKLKLVNYQWVTLNEKDHSVFLEKEGMRLDLGAIAKGGICDLVVRFLKENGVTTAIVDLGGNIFVMGHSSRGEDTAWNVGIQDPNRARSVVIFTLPGVNQSFVTSGIYERYLDVDGVRYHHLLDPQTGYPFDNNLASVSIVSDESIDGDGLSTTIFGLGLEAGMQHIEEQPGVEAVFVTKDNKVYVTSGLKDEFALPEGSDFTMGH